MAKKFRSASNSEWDDYRIWAESADLYILLKYYLPDSHGDGLVSYTSAMTLGLLLCKGTIYDKARILF